MNNTLVISNEVVRNTLTSLEVAEMMEVRHADLIKKLEGDSTHVGIIPVLSNQRQLSVVEYYQESTYVDAKGETRKCYDITKKGCEMLAHKMTGEKGIIFTAKYIERFHTMEEYIKANKKQDSYLIDDPIERAKAWIKEQEEKKALENKIKEDALLVGLAE